MAACAWNLRKWLIATAIFLFWQKVGLCMVRSRYFSIVPSKILSDFLNPALALLGQGLKKSPIGQKLDFTNHPYLCKGFI
jgi:hypothetical protein